MRPEDELRLHTFAACWRRETALRWAAWGVVVGLGVAVLLNAVAWTFPVLPRLQRISLSAGIPALTTLVAFVAAYLYPRSALDVARVADARMHLRDRLATAVEISSGRLQVPTEIAERQWDDACAAAAQADPRRAFALRFPRHQSLFAAVLIALLLVAFVLPNPQETVLARRQAARAEIARQAERLEKLRAEVAADESLSQEVKDRILRELDDTIRDLRRGDMSPEEALARLSQTEQELKKLVDEGVEAQAQAMEAAGRQVAQGARTQEMGRELAAGNYEQAAQAMEALGNELSNMSDAEREDTARRLEDMADAVAATDPELAQELRDAAQAMREGDAERAREALSRAAQRMRQVGKEVADQKALKRTLGQVQEGRRVVAQLGKEQCQCQNPGQQGQGQGQQGQGQQGQGQGQQGQGQRGQGQGRGQQGADRGGGSGHGDSDGSGVEGTPQEPGGLIPPNQPGRAGETPYEPVYVPDRLGDGEGEGVDVPGQGKGGPTVGQVDGAPPTGERALVPYDRVYADYQEQAAQALENSYIPQGVKDYVRDYFSSLDPAGR